MGKVQDGGGRGVEGVWGKGGPLEARDTADNMVGGGSGVRGDGNINTVSLLTEAHSFWVNGRAREFAVTWSTYLCLSVCLSVCLSLCVSLCVSLCPSVSVSLSLSFEQSDSD